MSYEAVKKIFSAYLEKAGHRKTPERFSILRQVYDTEGHFDVDSLYVKMKNNNYRVSRATLYNAIELLRKANIVTKHQFGNSVAQYEKSYKYQQHDHLICTECNEVFEFNDPRLEEIERSVERLMKFQITHHSFTFYGICSKCINKGKE